MRQRCEWCGKMVKDKFIFGLVHLCLSEYEMRTYGAYKWAVNDGRVAEWANAINRDRAERLAR